MEMVGDLLKQRFLEKVESGLPNECWNWTASTTGKGYGQIKIPSTRKQAYSHRLAYELAYGEIPKGKMVLHSCDNPRCCNPAHLSVGTCKDNLQDMVRKGRHLFGERNAVSKLTEIEVERILDLAKAGVTQMLIARGFNVSQAEVNRIIRGKRWTHVHKRRRESAILSGTSPGDKPLAQ
jgi:hypothetical protein